MHIVPYTRAHRERTRAREREGQRERERARARERERETERPEGMAVLAVTLSMVCGGKFVIAGSRARVEGVK